MLSGVFVTNSVMLSPDRSDSEFCRTERAERDHVPPGITVTRHLAVCPFPEALTVAIPSERAVTRPVPSTDATQGLVEW